MIKRTSRNFKVPLVYGGQWKDHQTFQKWDPISKRLVQVSCCAPEKTVNIPIPPDESWYPTYGYLVYESHLDVYPYGPVYFWCNSSGLVETIPVAAPDYNGTVATRNGNTYTVLGVVESIHQFVRVLASGDPGSGNFSVIPSDSGLPDVSLTISKTDKNNQNVNTFLITQIKDAEYIKIEKDIGNYVVLANYFTSSQTLTYLKIDCTIFSSVGIISLGDTATISA